MIYGIFIGSMLNILHTKYHPPPPPPPAAGREAENRNLTEEKMNIKLNIEILIEELRTTILWGNVCFIFCICRNFIFKTNDIACIIRNAPLQLLPDQGRRIFRRMSLIQLFIVFVLDIQRKITAVQDSVPGSLLHQ